eukprot:COSAG01_NODE_72172_length_253_cov_2.318182_1_plen_76_part_10
MGWDRGECMYSHANPKIDFRWPHGGAQAGWPRGFVMRGNVTWFLSTASLLAGAVAAAGHCPPTLRVAASSNRDAGL